MQCEYAKDAAGLRAVDSALRESLLQLARCAAQATRSCVQCCTVWSLLDLLTPAYNASGIYPSEHWHSEALKIVQLKLESDEWRTEMRRNLHAVRSNQNLWRYPIEDEDEANPPLLELCCFLFEQDTKLIDRIS